MLHVPSLDQLLVFSLAAAVVIAIPGPSVIFLVSRALSSGQRVAVLSVIGNALGEYVQVLAVAFGIGTLVEDSVFAFTALKLVGGAYLVYLGIKAFRQRGSLAAAIGAAAAPRSGRRSFAEAFTVGASNPKTIVFLAAMLPQFVASGSGSVPPQIMLLGAIFAGIAVLSDTVWVMLAARFRAWFGRSPRRLELIGGTGGLAIAAVGTGLLISGRKN
jgi:threonine/homoserine/homoserine lactone efflux protein